MMTSYQSKNTATSDFDEKGWVRHINKTLHEELPEELDFNVVVFTVPKSLMACDRSSYVPQQVSMGPYHFLDHDVLEMEKYKIDAAKIFQKQIKSPSLTFDHLVQQIKAVESKIRISHDRPLKLSCDTLALMLAIDSAFLLEFLKIYAVKEGRLVAAAISSKMSHLVDLQGKKSSHNALLRDLLMLENQIPLFILKTMLQSQFSSPEVSDETLLAMLMGLSKDVSPFKTSTLLGQTSKTYQQLDSFAHLLDYLFRAIVPEMEGEHAGGEEIIIQQEVEEEKAAAAAITFEHSSHVKEAFGKVWGMVRKVNVFKKLTSSRSVKALMKMPLDLVAKVPGVDKLKDPIEKLFFSGEEKDEENPENSDSDKAPLIEEITIPSVTDLARAGITFVPSHDGISSISFDPKTATLSLPVVCLDINSEVVLRNLVAYEACRAKGPLVLARYTEFMNGIVDTEEDAMVLISKGIIVSQLKSQAEVASLWNGMDKSVRLTKVQFLDEVIEGVNEYYSQRWKVKAIKFARAYIFGSWKLLTFMATIMLLSMVALQAFCSVYTCSRWFTDIVLENETGKN
ncbi:PREDICTED: putative UPF0481 protein At3g02645 [Ipomoea nil]|uniref:putative UPF0481 protein At3g02645 n=1 Tax=Ipomoea nil TaxID=35883 RepID=UPI00090184F3|nr:PREDICTED: putative UPF0481 protein At3g02645 [Ipomoea nil]